MKTNRPYLLLFSLVISAVTVKAATPTENELRFCIGAQPKTFNPLLVDDDASETVRYLTGGVLLRLDRNSQKLLPELATAWSINHTGNAITFTLRENIHFSDGTPFSADDIAYTMEQLMDPGLHSPTGDAFRSSPGKLATTILGKYRITVTFPAPIVAPPPAVAPAQYTSYPCDECPLAFPTPLARKNHPRVHLRCNRPSRRN